MVHIGHELRRQTLPFTPQHVLDMMMRKKREAVDFENQVPPQIDTLLLIDRNVDLLTPLFTQLTYEGLIDELYGIHNSELCCILLIGLFRNGILCSSCKSNTRYLKIRKRKAGCAANVFDKTFGLLIADFLQSLFLFCYGL